MADESVTPQTPLTTQEAPAAAPSVETTTVANPEPAPAAAPPEQIQTDTAQPEATKEVAKPEPTLLGGEETKVEEKTDEPKADDKKPEATTDDKKSADGAEKQPDGDTKESSQSDEPAPLPTYEAFAFPEGVTFDEAKLADFTKELGEFESLSKADHASVQQFGQRMVDRYVSELNEAVERIDKVNREYWEKQSQDWLTKFENDPEIGGPRKDTTTNSAREFIRRFGGTSEQQTEIRSILDQTKLGNHPAMIRLLANANLAKREGKPVPASTPAPAKMSKIQKRYGNKTNA